MRIILLAIQMVLLALPVRADDALDRAFGASTAALLRAGSIVRQSVPADGSLLLVPAVSSRAVIKQEMQDFRPTVGVEALRLIKRAGPAMRSAADWVPLFNVFHAASTLQGTRYWSVTRGKEDVLFTQSYSVNYPSPAKVPDPVFTTIPAESTFYTFQQDNSFGKNTYEETFSFPGDDLAIKIENLTPISFVFVPIVKPRGFVVRVVVLPVGDSLVFYGTAALRTTLPLGNRGSREDSLANRLVAMSNWLEKQLAAAMTSS
jgi:hypothetical protein